MSANKLYHLYIRHEAGECPSLPAPFAYLDTTYDPHECPVHPVLVFEASARIALVRKRIEELKKVSGIIKIWLYYGSHVKESDCWQKEGSTWQKR